MNGSLGHNAVLQGYTGPGTSRATEIDFAMNHAPDARSLARPGNTDVIGNVSVRLEIKGDSSLPNTLHSLILPTRLMASRSM